MARVSTIFAAGLVVAMAAGGQLMAAGKAGLPGSNRFERLKNLDRDNDKAVSAEEYVLAQQKRFTERDANKDGVLTAEEIVFSRAPKRGGDRAERLLKRFDINKDGRVSAEEFEQGEHTAFTKRDKNADGRITGEEVPRFRGRRGGGAFVQENATLADVLAGAKVRFKTLDSNGDGTVDTGEIASTEAVRREYLTKREMHRFDANRDGTVTQDEYMIPAKRRFTGLDIDNDGRITADDLPPGVRSQWSAP